MEISSAQDENWQVLLSLFPEKWKEYANKTGAMVRKLRKFASEDAVMRTLLIHITMGYSLGIVAKINCGNISRC